MNKERFLKTVKELGTIGWTDSGLQRVTFSPDFIKGRNYVADIMQDAGMTVRIDRIGNIFGRYNITKGDRTILTGSHLDSVAGGGIYDGHLGVLSSIEAARSLYEQDLLNNSLEVVGFNGEEGSPLGGTFGSRSICGDFTQLPTDLVLQSYALTKEDIYSSKVDFNLYKCFLELHIEQGPVLWRRNIPIGIPTAIVGITRYKVTIIGQTNHAGTTPMEERCDAMREAIRIINEWYKIVDELPERNFVYNIGKINLTPNEPPVIAGKAEFVIEMRSTDHKVVDLLVNHLSNIIDTATLPTTKEKLIDKDPVLLNIDLRKTIQNVCKEQNLMYLDMPSGAGHDASPISKHIPTAMIFIPSINGVSHSKDELSSVEDMITGVSTLEKVLYELSKNSL